MAALGPIPRWIIVELMTGRYRRAAFRRWRTPEFSPLRAVLYGEQSVEVAAAPAAVWEILADVPRVGEWSHECHSAAWLDGATAAAPGARFRGRNRSGRSRWSRTCTVTEVVPERALGWITHGGIYGDHTEWRYTLEPAGTGTRITQTYRVQAMPRWFDRLAWRITPAHHDRREALRDDLSRLGLLAAHAPSRA
ncbi:SRPBCC family protein [Nocardia sp. NPDC057353]|uniref:SRPBCC family protein n=1 Tax=Nocardia sp. NPDC057353 TaxID=3346104 RepID=UPI0036321446